MDDREREKRGGNWSRQCLENYDESVFTFGPENIGKGEDYKSKIKRFGKLYVAFLGLNYAILRIRVIYIYIYLWKFNN